MKKVTFDKNCLIDLEENRQPFAGQLTEVVRLAGIGMVQLSIPASAATERPKPGEASFSNFKLFSRQIDALGLEVDYLAPIMRLDMDFLDLAVAGTGEGMKLERDIFYSIAPPGLTWEPPKDPSLQKKWRNVVNDARAVWCHIQYGTDVLLTRDRKLVSRASQMNATILSPADFLRTL